MTKRSKPSSRLFGQRRAATRVAGVGVLFVLGGCASAEPVEQNDTMADSIEVAAAPEPDPNAPNLPLLLGEGPTRDFQLVLINPSDRVLSVSARAGSTEVVLDTVPAGDSTRVDIRVRADRLDLVARDASGAEVTREEVELDSDSLNRWIAEPRPARPAPVDAEPEAADTTQNRL